MNIALMEALMESPRRLRRYGTAAVVGGIAGRQLMKALLRSSAHNGVTRLNKKISQLTPLRNKLYPSDQIRNKVANAHVTMLQHVRNAKRPGGRWHTAGVVRDVKNLGTAAGAIAGTSIYGSYRLARKAGSWLLGKLRKK